MRALTGLVVGMGVLIVLGVIGLGVALTQRLSAPASLAPLQLDEPAGSRIAAIAGTPDGLAVQLQGGGPDRVVVVGARTGQVLRRITLPR